jgi:hypothetical protein
MISEITEIPMEQRFTMGQVAKEAGVYKNTLKNWEEAGHVPKPKRERGGNCARVYTLEEKERVLAYARSRKELIDAPPPKPPQQSQVSDSAA